MYNSVDYHSGNLYNHYQSDMVGGNIGKSFKNAGRKVGREINKGWKNNQKFLNKQVLPTAVSIGIPVASASLGALATAYGGPAAGMAAQQITQNALNLGVPDKYKSNNKWVNFIGDTAGSLTSLGLAPTPQFGDNGMPIQQDINPYQQIMYENMGNLSNEMALEYSRKNKNKKGVQRDLHNPYADLIQQSLNKYQNTTMPIRLQEPINVEELQQTESIVKTLNQENEETDAIYGKSRLGKDADDIRITTPPYQQKEGSYMGLLGAGVKRGRRTIGRPKKKRYISDDDEVYVRTKPSYKKFSHPKNSSLEQLLEANEEKKRKSQNTSLYEMIDKQNKLLNNLLP